MSAVIEPEVAVLLRDGLQRMLAMHESMLKKTNHAASYFDADTRRQMDEAPLVARRALTMVAPPKVERHADDCRAADWRPTCWACSEGRFKWCGYAE